MRHLILLLVFCSTTVFADDAAELREIKSKLWNQAYRTQDVELLDRILHDSLETIDNDGNRSTKAKELDYIANNKWDPGSFEYRIERLQIYANGTGIASNYTYKSSNVLIREDGRWQAVLSHVSGFKPKD